MGYIPKFIHFDHFIDIRYPFGVCWEHGYIQECVEAIYNTYKKDIEEDMPIIFIVRGTSGAMIAGAILNELHNINPLADIHILIVRKDSDVSAHCTSLEGMENFEDARIIVVDDFIQSGHTIKAILKSLDNYFKLYSTLRKKYDMLCIGNVLNKDVLKNNKCDNYKKWRSICSRFEYVVCSPS